MKSISKNKLLHCFRPMVDVDVVINEPTTTSTVNINRSRTDRAFTYPTAENHAHKIKFSGSDNNGCLMNSEKNSKTVRQPGKRTFSRVVKAVFLETILAKRIRDPKGFRTKEGPSMDLGGKTTHEPTISAPKKGFFQETNSSSSSSEPKSIFSSKTNLSKTAKVCHKDQTEKPQSRFSNTGLYLLLIILATTVLWGTFCAIIFTSVLLCFITLPCSGNRRQESVKKPSSSEIRVRRSELETGIKEKEMKIRRALNF